MKEIPFSVAMGVYGKDDPRYFHAAVNSLLDQTVLPQEIVLVVDGPVPEELDAVIGELERDARFHVIRFAQNRGHGEARRAAIEACRYEWIALMDADDLALPERFEKQLAVIAADDTLSAVGGQITEFVGEPTNIIGERAVPETDEAIKRYMKTRCPFNQVTVMLKKADVQRAGGYLDWYCNEDYYLWLRMAANGCRFANMAEVLVNVRAGQEMINRRGGWRLFKSELKLQNYMLRSRVIGIGTYLLNTTKRLVVQLLLPDAVRGWVYQKFARRAVTRQNNGKV